MPCTLEPWEVAYEESRANKEKFGRKLTDAALLEEVACGACRTLVRTGDLNKAPVIVRKWWKLHHEKDLKEGRN